MILAEHFAQAPNWRWWIVLYFFLAGLAGGSFVLGSLLRVFGGPADEGASRLGFLVALPILAVCPILLTIDLGRPERFWHMLIDSRVMQLEFKYWSPMQLGAWALLLFGIFALVAFLEAVHGFGWVRIPAGDRLSSLIASTAGRVFLAVGSLLALYICAYTGVLLSVSNQPEWSDAWPLGGLFLASAMAGSAALLGLLARRRREGAASVEKVESGDRLFVLLEVLLLIVFLATLLVAGTLGRAFSGGYALLWILVLLGLAVPLLGGRMRLPGAAVAAPILALIGVLALRTVVIFTAQ